MLREILKRAIGEGGLTEGGATLRARCALWSRFALLWLWVRRTRVLLIVFLSWVFVTTDSTVPWLIWWTVTGGPDRVDASITTNCSARNYSLPLIVVMPLIASQSSRLQTTVLEWPRHDLYPCNSSLPRSNTSVRPALAIYFDSNVRDARMQETITIVKALFSQKLVAKTVHECFSEVFITGASMSERQTKNSGSLSLLTSLVSTGGSNRQFENAFRIFGGKRFRHMWYMEPDTWPTRAGWLDAIEKESTWGDFWVRGTVMRYTPRFHIGWEPYRTRYFRHINGNAIYALDDECFLAFRRVVTAAFGDKAFDVAMMLTLLDVGQIALYQQVAFRFQYSRVVADVGVMAMDRAMTLDSFPGTFLVHGKYAFVKRERLSSASSLL